MLLVNVFFVVEGVDLTKLLKAGSFISNFLGRKPASKVTQAMTVSSSKL